MVRNYDNLTKTLGGGGGGAIAFPSLYYDGGMKGPGDGGVLSSYETFV